MRTLSHFYSSGQMVCTCLLAALLCGLVILPYAPQAPVAPAVVAPVQRWGVRR